MRSEMFVAPRQILTTELFATIVDRISLKPLLFLAKRFMLDISLGPGCAFGYDTVLKIQTEVSP